MDRMTPLILTVWMLEKSENIPVPAALVVMNVLPQALVMFSGKLKRATGGVTESSRVALQAGSNMWFRIRRVSL